jgi:DNA-binding CsgD family transcriptional regulator
MININNPDFKNAAKVHDWRNYVPCDWQKNWEQFTERERQIIAVMAQSQADKEEWD